MKKTEYECECRVLHKEAVAAVKKEFPDDIAVQNVADFFSVLGDSTRVKILWTLDKKELCVCDIAAVLNMTKSAVSHQLRVLKEHRLVTNRRKGKEVFYSLHDDHVREIFEKAGEHLEEK